MNDSSWKVSRVRKRTLLIVEGNHEKNELFRLLFKCFPEINIDMDDVWIYGTNIYMLHEDIVAEYGPDWTDVDIDLPFVISKKKKYADIQYKSNFTNIIMIFDYERHDPKFDENKILKMQQYFMDATDVGRLYINYLMIESYQHLTCFPDDEYENRQVSVTVQPGIQYKRIVRDMPIVKDVNLLCKVDEILQERYEVQDEVLRRVCVEGLLAISELSDLDKIIELKLSGIVAPDKLNTAKFQLVDTIVQRGYLSEGKSYWNYMRSLFRQIIIHNICKANKIQNEEYQIGPDLYKECFEQLDLEEILRKQNEVSRNPQKGYIWVLNTCVFLIADYNFSLVT